MAVNPDNKPKLKDVRARNDARLMELAGVVGVGEGVKNGRPCIKVYVARKSKALTQRLPQQIEGFPVVIEQSGEFEAL